MFGHHASGYFFPKRFDDPRAYVLTPPPPREPTWCSRCKWCLVLLTSTGFVMSLIGGLYFLFIKHGPLYFSLCVLSAIICLFLYILAIHIQEPSLHTSRSTTANWKIFQGGSVTIAGRPQRADSIIGLPARLVIPLEGQGEHAAPSKSSTESTPSSDEGQDGAGSSKEKSDVKPLAEEEMGEATGSVVKGSAEAAGEGSSQRSAEAGREVLQGVRQRRQSPVKPPKHVSSPEDEKTK